MSLAGPRLPERAFPGTTNFACRWQARFREALFLREVVVFDQGCIVVGAEFVKEVLVDEADVRFDVVNRYGCEWGW